MFNDKIACSKYEWFINKFDCKTAIETGTHLGNGTRNLLKYHDNVISCESYDEFFQETLSRFISDDKFNLELEFKTKTHNITVKKLVRDDKTLFLLKGRFKYWILTLTILSIFLAWGKNFMPLTELFLDFFPGYNKFRAVSMILIVAEFTLPLLAFLAFNNFIFSDANKLSKIKSLKNAFFVIMIFSYVVKYYDWKGGRLVLFRIRSAH